MSDDEELQLSKTEQRNTEESRNADEENRNNTRRENR